MKVDFNNIYYLTQYANYMSDEGVLEMFQEHVDGMDEDDAEEYLEILYTISQELMPNITDEVNQKIFGVLTLTEDLSTLAEIVGAISRDDFQELDELTNYGLSDFMTDYSIYSPYTWEEIADSDLRENGIEASCLYWAIKIDYSYDYLQLNAYENGFNHMDEIDVFEEFVSEHLDFNDYI